MLLNLFNIVKPNLAIDVLKGLHRAEKEEVNGKFPFRFYFLVFLIPLVVAIGCTYYYPKPTENFNNTIVQILAIITGLLITSLVPFYEIAANSILKNLSKNHKKAESSSVSDFSVDKIRVNLMLISYSVIAFSLLLSVVGIVLCLLSDINFSFISPLEFRGVNLGSPLAFLFGKTIIFLYYFTLLVNLSNLFNIIKYTNSLVIPVFEELIKLQKEKDEE